MLEDLLEGLEQDPEQSWNAFQGLEAIDSESRLRIVAELLKARGGEGLNRLLVLLAESRDDQTRGGGRSGEADVRDRDDRRASITAVASGRWLRRSTAKARGQWSSQPSREGGVSAAAFLCDVRKGVLDVLGVVEAGQAAEAELYEQFVELSSGQCVEDAPDLAFGLLAGEPLGFRPVDAAGRAVVARRDARRGFPHRARSWR